MKEVDRTLVELAGTQHQVFTRRQARDAGLSASALSRRLAAGQLVACGTAALHLPGATLTYRGRLMAGLLDLGPDAVVSGRAAAHLHGLDGFGEGPLEFLGPRSYRSRSTSGTLRVSGTLERKDWTVVNGLRCTSATRTVIELLATATLDEAGDALASATRMRLTAPAVVERRLTELGRSGRAGVAAFDELLRASVVESGLERQLLRVVAGAGLPQLVLQQRYRLAGLGVARVDFELAGLPIVVEVGGRRGYLSAGERQRQERRRNQLQLLGKTVYFFTRHDVFDRPADVIATLHAAVEREVVSPACARRNSA